jgi:hypothetical protein
LHQVETQVRQGEQLFQSTPPVRAALRRRGEVGMLCS